MSTANAVTGVRVILTPAFIVAVAQWWVGLALVIFVLVAASDLVDGAVARRSGAASEQGRMWDHLADIAFLLPALGLFAWRGTVTPWLTVAAAVAFLHYLGAAWKGREGTLVLPPTRLGHLAGVLNYCVVGTATAALLARTAAVVLPVLAWVAVAANGLSVLSRWCSRALWGGGRKRTGGSAVFPCRGARWFILVLAVLPVAGGCTPQHARYTVRRASIGCVTASRLAYETFVGLGYQVEVFEVARPDQPGLVVGKKDGKQAAVKVACDAQGITAIPEPGKILPDLEFVRGFHFAYTYRLDHPPREEACPPTSSVHAPAPEVPPATGGVRVTVRPHPGLEAKSYIGVDPTPAGLLPVEVTVANAGKRTLRLRTAAVVLVTREGRRVPPLARREVRARLGEAADRVLEDQAVKGGQSATGFLFYPLGEYRGARAILEDAATGEKEGFLAEF